MAKSSVAWRAHAAQSSILRSPARFKYVACGRRFGKTELGAAWILHQGHTLLEAGYDAASIQLWWVAPTWELVTRGFNVLTRATKEDGSVNPFRSTVASASSMPGRMRVMTRAGYAIQFKSGENPEQLEGEGVHGLVADEAAALRQKAFENSLYPALTVTQAPALVISKPMGRNWFYARWQRARERPTLEAEAWQFDTLANPLIPKSSVDEARATLPERVFRQEYLGEFVDDSGGVFQGVRARVTGELAGPERGQAYVAGWDVAKHTDYSVLNIDRLRDRHTVHFDRFQKVPYPEQVKRVAAAVRRYDATLLMDSTGAGDPVYDYMAREGVKVYAYTFTHASKANLINNLAVSIAEGSCSYPDLPVLVNELEMYEWKEGGRSGAPEGWHDDCVMAKALSVFVATRLSLTQLSKEPMDLSAYY